MLNVDFISDPELRRLYAGLRNGLEATVLLDGKALLDDGRASDPIALLYAMKIAGLDMIEDLKEHGDEHLDLYDGLTAEEARTILLEVDARLQTLQRDGMTSPVWDEFRARAREHYNRDLKRARHGLLQ